MRLSFDFIGAERPATSGARLAAAAGTGDDAAAFDISALLLPMLAAQPQPAPAMSLVLGDAVDAVATDEVGESAVAKKTLPLMFLRPDLNNMPAVIEMKADAAQQEVEPASAKPNTVDLNDSIAPDATPLLLMAPSMAAEPVAILAPAARQSISVEYVISALDAPVEPPVAAVDLLKAQLALAVKTAATDVAKDAPVVNAPAADAPVADPPAANAPAADFPMLMAEVAEETPKGASVEAAAPKRAVADLPASAERGPKSLKSSEREPERRISLKGEPVPAVGPHETATPVRPVAAAHLASADHDAQRAVRIVTNSSSLTSGSALTPSDASMERTTMSELPSRLIESMRMQINAGGGQAEIRLSPEFLGSVKVSIVVDHGSVKATLTAETPAALDALRGDIGRLRDALEEHGLRLDEFELREDPSARQDTSDSQSKPQQEPKDERRRPQQRELTTAGGPAFGEVFDVVA